MLKVLGDSRSAVATVVAVGVDFSDCACLVSRVPLEHDIAVYFPGQRMTIITDYADVPGAAVEGVMSVRLC